MAARRRAKRRYQYCTDDSGIIVYFRALQGHSRRKLIDPSLQDNVVIQSGLFQHIYHIGSAFNLHSIINNGLIPGGQNSSKRQTVFFLPVDPTDKGHKDPEKIDLNVPRRAKYLHTAWKKHQDAENWVDIDLAIRKGLTFYQTRLNEIPKVVRLKTGEVFFEKAYMSPRPPPKISLRHDWTKEFGSKVDRQPQKEVARHPRKEVAQQPRGEVSRQAKFFQPTQPIPKPICDRSRQPDNKHEVFVDKSETSWSREIKEKSSHEELCSSDRSRQPDITPSVIRAQTNLSGEIRVEQTHDRSGQPDKSHYEQPLKYIMRSRRSTPTMSQFVKELRKTWTSKFQDYHILL